MKCIWCGEGANDEQGEVVLKPDGDYYHDGCYESNLEWEDQRVAHPCCGVALVDFCQC